MSNDFYANTEYFNDSELQQAARLVNHAMLSSLPTGSECCHTFSPEFKSKMALLLRKAGQMERLHQWTRGIAAAILAVVIGLSSWLIVDVEARATFLKWVREVYESSIIYHFFQDTPTTQDVFDYAPTWLPDGYEQVDVITASTEKIVVYQQEQDETTVTIFRCFAFSQSEQYELFVDESQYKSIEVQAQGAPAYLYQPIDSRHAKSLIWFNKDETIMFSLESFLDSTVMLHIAESVNLED